ncbi:hypothetical protein SAMN00790413_05766 [Deinococcus hopiensis KR-140]|uniref:Uncharacterized protein n=1 Tax=Deinococcus hopiensis KR-140 TaxID=695939 RepID=A0A1W1UDH2_9DEIO|nr:hypothetical protein SAMN00790413_05766 [Deinococcus hopiensis KR-140]
MLYSAPDLIFFPNLPWPGPGLPLYRKGPG